MTSAIQIRRDTAANVAAATPLQGELGYTTDTKELVIGDGITAGGGVTLARKDHIHNASAKTTLADADEMDLADSAASYVPKKITWANVYAALWSVWGAVIAAGTGKTTPADADTMAIADSAASSATKKLTWANAKAAIWVALGPAIAALTGKTTPVDADSIVIQDSASTNASKQVTWANVKATLKTYLDTLYQPLAAALTNFTTLVGTIVAGDIIYGSGAATLARLAKGSDGQVLTLASGLPAWSAAAGGGGVTARNRIVNPAMQISSINGNTAGTTNGYVPADNWVKNHVSSAGTLTVQRVQSVTPKGAKDRIRCTITVADASLAAGEYLLLSQNLIGREVADFQYGSASAKQGLLRFLFKGPAGTYAISLQNSAVNRSYVALFTISAGQANTDTIQTFTIAGDTTGTWLTDTGTGITLTITLAAGSTFQGTTGWQAGNILGTSGVSNGMATGAAVFEIGEVGFYLDVASLGTFPTWELPSYTADYDYLAVVTPWVAYTPAVVPFGTCTAVSFASRRVGKNLEVIGVLTAGTCTGSTGTISFGFNGVSGNVTADATLLPSSMLVGDMIVDASLSASVNVRAVGGATAMTYGRQGAGLSPFTDDIASTVPGTGVKIALKASIPITGW